MLRREADPAIGSDDRLARLAAEAEPRREWKRRVGELTLFAPDPRRVQPHGEAEIRVTPSEVPLDTKIRMVPKRSGVDYTWWGVAPRGSGEERSPRGPRLIFELALDETRHALLDVRVPSSYDDVAAVTAATGDDVAVAQPPARRSTTAPAIRPLPPWPTVSGRFWATPCRPSPWSEAAGPPPSWSWARTSTEPVVERGGWGHDGPVSDEPQSPRKLDLSALRNRIDAIDKRLVELLNERASIVVDIGELKRSTGDAIYAPHREAEVLRRALAHNVGPLPDRTIEAVYRELMSGSFAIERPLRIGFLGPPGSFSHVAATSHFGSSVSFENLREIGGVFTEVRREHVDYGLVPIENSTGGGIAETLDAFRDAAGEVFVYAEIALTIRHNLLANCEPREVRRIYSKPEVFAQCRTWLSTQYPQAELVAAPSSSQAVIQARDDDAAHAAAIGSSLAGRLYGMRVLFEDIEDNPNNITRFFVIARHEAQPSGDDKTSLMFTTKHEPGALVRVLQAFATADINLTHIDKRPSRRENWSYTFFLDAVGHRHDQRMASTIENVRRHCQELWVLGSYPRAARIR